MICPEGLVTVDLPRPAATPTIAAIQAAVAACQGTTVAEMLSARRTAGAVTARQLAMWLARWWTPASLPRIGRAFGRDHTTVMHAVAVLDRRPPPAALVAMVCHRLDGMPAPDPMLAPEDAECAGYDIAAIRAVGAWRPGFWRSGTWQPGRPAR